ncbi:hypothetical protein [Vibrio vulnificus]|uniref:hypothetical protein n=1 Tax=Vibrio vulnificus TaxID=672 RepID=UPI001A1AAF87|nr:hypothetical protein [Vibrio vulnificus]MCA0766299.1 hypothetical protein [Vibrio vulnificus]HAT8542841.1 hypothetical protein [Vibrio vulnificus]
MRHIVETAYHDEALQLIENLIAEYGLKSITRDSMRVNLERALKSIFEARYVRLTYDNCYRDQLTVDLGFAGEYTLTLTKEHNLLKPY